MVINADDSRVMPYWDGFVASLLFATALLCPFEIAFLEPKVDLLFFVNRMVDCAFITDMVCQFFIAVHDPKTGALSYDPAFVARNYMAGWFWIDILSVVPVDLFCLYSVSPPLNVKILKLTKVIRLFRLVRLLRLARLHRIMNRWNAAYGLNYSVLSLAQFSTILLVAAHWMACLWGGLAHQANAERNWMHALQASKGGPDHLYTEPINIYWISLYWAVMTLTTIGYGDITAQNREEYVVATLCMTIMAGTWAYTIGAVCGIVSTLQPHDVNFKQMMDDLNSMMESSGMPYEIRKKLRRYFHESRELSRKRHERKVMDHMTPMLQGEVALFLYQDYLKKVPYINNLGNDALIHAARRLTVNMYVPGEDIREDRALVIVKSGICSRRGKILSAGAFWGEDMILWNSNLRDTSHTRALSYLHVLVFQYQTIQSLIVKFPQERSRMHMARVQLGITRAVILTSRTILRKGASWKTAYDELNTNQRQKMVYDILEGKLGDDLDYYRSYKGDLGHRKSVVRDDTPYLLMKIHAKLEAMEKSHVEIREVIQDLKDTVTEC